MSGTRTSALPAGALTGEGGALTLGLAGRGAGCRAGGLELHDHRCLR
jgi:hypothetical protein